MLHSGRKFCCPSSHAVVFVQMHFLFLTNPRTLLTMGCEYFPIHISLCCCSSEKLLSQLSTNINISMLSIQNVIVSCKWSPCNKANRLVYCLWYMTGIQDQSLLIFALPTSWRTTPCQVSAATCFINAISGGYLLHHVMVSKDPLSKGLQFDL